MYEERKNTFTVRDIILQLFMIVLFILIMIWLFPTKGYLSDNFVGKDELSSELSEQLQALYGRLFADNIESMRDAAQGYFTNARLPQKIGDSVTLTLKEMLEKKLVLSFKDSNNQSCDVNKSYVKVTKMNDEYQMKVQLSCSDYEDYIIVYMGCYDYCDSEICMKEETTPITKPDNSGKTDKPDNKPDNKPDDEPDDEPGTPVVNKKYKYEYRLDVQNSYSSWGPWSSWSKDRISVTNLRQVEIEKRLEVTGYKTQTYTDYEIEVRYKEQTTQVQIGSRPVTSGGSVDTKPAQVVSSGGGGYGSWVFQTVVTSNSPLYDSNTVKYEYVSHKTTVDCSNVCQNVTTYTYKKYTRSYSSGSTSYSCAAYPGYTLEGSNCVKRTGGSVTYEPIYETVTTKVPYKVVVEVQKTRQVPVKGYVTYYRYRTRKQLTVAGTYYKWSTSKNDQTLLSQGYYLTGNKKEV